MKAQTSLCIHAVCHARIQRAGGLGVLLTLLEKLEATGILSNTGLDPLENYTATRPGLNVGPP